jgi:hypothetical protein
MNWRYQPVWGEDRAGDAVQRWYSLCEVYFDETGRLEAWIEDPSIRPMGNDPADLRGDLARMLADAWKWKPVKSEDLKVGMTFERAITQEQADKIASMIEGMAEASGVAEKQLN